MSKGFTVTLNEQTIHTYNDSRAPGRLRRFMDEMDRDMQSGVQLADEWVEQPSELQKQQYVAMVLFDALEKKDSNLVSLMSSYLIERYETLEEIRITQQEDLINLQIISK